MPGDAAESAVAHDNLLRTHKKELLAKQAKKGTLGLPALLDRRRLEHGIPNGAFKAHSLFDWILVWQIAQFDSVDGTYGDTRIILTEKGQAMTREEAPRGIIISAGLAALDNLRSNGVDLGHIVRFIRNAPMRIPVEMIGGRMLYGIKLKDGDVTDSEDLQEALAKGECKVELRSFTQPNGEVKEKHVYIDKDGKQWQPQMPWMGDDY
jgi:hypothetical protein